MASISSSDHGPKTEVGCSGGGVGGGGGGGGGVVESSETVAASDQMLLYRGFKKAKKERGCTAKERISKMPPCTAGKRSSIYRGVTRHRWTGRYEAHLWDKSTWNQNQNKKGKQVYLGAYDDEEAAARAYDLAALKYWGPGTLINFPVTDYTRDLEEMQNLSREEYLASLRRKSSGFSRGIAKYRGLQSCKPDAETYNALINAHGRAGQWRWAMNLLDDMLRAAIPPSRTTYNNLINACGSSGNWREALEVCKKMTDNGVGPDLVTHNIVLSAYKSGRQYSKALSYFELMKGAKIRPDTTTFNIIIYCMSKLGQTSQALDVFSSMREKRAECRPDIVTFTSIMHLYSVRGEIENCRAVFEAMLAEGLKPNIVSYNALMGAYAVHGMSENALSVFQEIKQNGMLPDVVSYTCLLNSYGRSRQPGKAKDVFIMMRKERRKPNVVTYNALIDAYGSNGFLAEAMEIFRQMEQDCIKPNVVSICTLLAACSRSGKKANVEAVLSAAQSRGIKLNTAAYNSAIGSYINAANFEKANALYQTMRKRKLVDSVTFTILISGSCRMLKYSEAINYFEEMKDLCIPFTKEVYSSVLCAYSKQGQVTEAESIFNQMKMGGCEPDVIAYTSMLHAYNASEYWGKACELFLEMEVNGIAPDSIACSALMRAFNKGGQPSKVFVLMDFMREKEIPFTGAVFFEIFSACNTLQEWKRTVDLIQLMEPYLPSLSIGLTNQILHLFGKSGKVEAMMKLFYKITASDVEVNLKTYGVLLQHLLAAGNWRKYIEVLEWMSDSGIQPLNHMYSDITSFGERSAGIELEPVIRRKIESLRNKGADPSLPRRDEDTLYATTAIVTTS